MSIGKEMSEFRSTETGRITIAGIFGKSVGLLWPHPNLLRPQSRRIPLSIVVRRCDLPSPIEETSAISGVPTASGKGVTHWGQVPQIKPACRDTGVFTYGGV